MRHWHRMVIWGMGIYATLTVIAGLGMLPSLLLQAPVPRRTEGEREKMRASLAEPGDAWHLTHLKGGQGTSLEVWRLQRRQAKGVAILLHGFGDDAWGTASLARELPDLDVVVWTFRGRDRTPSIPSTLGAWEPKDAVEVVHHLEASGVSRARMVLVGVSQGAGVALLTLQTLEQQGPPLAGALLESPWKDLEDAAHNHVRGTLGVFEPLSRPAVWLGLWRAGRIAFFEPGSISPYVACKGLKTPVALLAGDQDTITPLAGVQAMAAHHPDLTVVPGASHLEAGRRLQGGWGAWAHARLSRWLPPATLKEAW